MNKEGKKGERRVWEKKSSRGEEDSRQEKLEKIEERREGGGIKERFPKVKKKKKRERENERMGVQQKN